MERIVKERLVGAAVLMAAAIILIPEMLGGPDRGSQATAAMTPAASIVRRSRIRRRIVEPRARAATRTATP